MDCIFNEQILPLQVCVKASFSDDVGFQKSPANNTYRQSHSYLDISSCLFPPVLLPSPCVPPSINPFPPYSIFLYPTLSSFPLPSSTDYSLSTLSPSMFLPLSFSLLLSLSLSPFFLLCLALSLPLSEMFAPLEDLFTVHRSA